MDTNHSNIDYHEFEDTTNATNDDTNYNPPSLYLSVTEDQEYRDNSMNNTFRSINLEEPTEFKNTQDIWKPTDENTWKHVVAEPWDYSTSSTSNTIQNKYYDTDKISNSIEDTTNVLRTTMGNLNERKSKLNNIESLTDMLTENGNKFKKHSRTLQLQQISKYTFHITCIGSLVILIITLIVILAKS
jgi:hypothetical protein